MIEITILNYLKTKLSEPVYLELPAGNDNIPCVVIGKTGSRESNFIKTSTFAMRSYGRSLYEAAELNERLKEAMRSAIELDDISKVEVNSDYNFTDTATKRYRYQAVFNITHY